MKTNKVQPNNPAKTGRFKTIKEGDKTHQREENTQTQTPTSNRQETKRSTHSPTVKKKIPTLTKRKRQKVSLLDLLTEYETNKKAIDKEGDYKELLSFMKNEYAGPNITSRAAGLAASLSALAIVGTPTALLTACTAKIAFAGAATQQMAQHFQQQNLKFKEQCNIGIGADIELLADNQILHTSSDKISPNESKLLETANKILMYLCNKYIDTSKEHSNKVFSFKKFEEKYPGTEDRKKVLKTVLSIFKLAHKAGQANRLCNNSKMQMIVTYIIAVSSIDPKAEFDKGLIQTIEKPNPVVPAPEKAETLVTKKDNTTYWGTEYNPKTGKTPEKKQDVLRGRETKRARTDKFNSTALNKITSALFG
mgnify:CR=1 FL=1|jgi:hypothetical protein